LQKLFTNSSLTEGSNASTTRQASDNCCSKLVSSDSFPVPKLRQKQKIGEASYIASLYQIGSASSEVIACHKRKIRKKIIDEQSK